MKAHHALVADFIPFSWVDGPGNRFVLFLQGCNFNCLACHNPQTIPLHSQKALLFSIAEVIEKLRQSMPYISGVTVSGGEATMQHEFIFELFAQIKQDPELGQLTTFIDSNGNTPEEIWRTLAPVTDGVMIDLKVLDDSKHVELTGSSNEKVINSISVLARLAKLYEVRLLLVPGQNDSESDLVDTARFLLEIDPNIRVKINSFMTHGVRATARQWNEPTTSDKEHYRALLSAHGISTIA